MVGVLIGMKLAVMRRTATGPRANTMLAGGVLGIAAAIATIALATLDADQLTTVMDLLAIAFATWAIGWLLAPAYSGQPVLRPEQFALLPISPRRLAIGLLGTAFVGVSTLITLAAFAAMVAFIIVGCIALFPQALVPALMKACGDVARVWFLALYMPSGWQWPTIVFMFLLGIGAFVLAWRVYAAEDRAMKRRRAAS